MIKKFLALSICLMISASALTSCASKSSSSNPDSVSDSTVDENTLTTDNELKLIIDGEEVDTDGLVMCTIDGFDISYDEFRYYWMFYYNQLSALGYDVESGSEEVISLLKYNTIKDLSSTYAMMGLAKENDLEYMASEEDLQTAYMYQLMQYETEDAYHESLLKNHMTDNAMQAMLASYLAYDTAYNELFGEGGKFFIDNDSVIEAFSSDEVARCVHILIPYSACVEISDDDKEVWDSFNVASKYNTIEIAYADLDEDQKKEVAQKSLELAQEVQERAKSGEDFFSLIEQYNYDPGMEPQEGQSYSDISGYYFTKDYNYVKEFIDGTFALGENEISDVITSENYGYHIILRLPVDIDYVQENIESLAKEYNEINASKIFNEHLDNIDITYSDYFDKLTIDSIN